MLVTAQPAAATAGDLTSEAVLQSLEPALIKLFDISASLESTGSGAFVSDYHAQVFELSQLAKQQQLRGISHVASLFDRGLKKLVAEQRDLSSGECAVLAAWPANILAEVFGTEDPDPQAPWVVLNDLRGNAWFPDVPDHFVTLIQGWLAEDAGRLAAGSTQTESSFSHSSAFPLESLPVLQDVVSEVDYVEVWDSDRGELVTGGDVDATMDESHMAMPEPLPKDSLDDGSENAVLIADLVGEGQMSPGKVAVEELEMLGDALRGLQEEFGPVFQSSVPAEVMGSFLEQYTEQLEHILNATVHLGMPGLQKVIEIIQVNSVSLQMAPEAITAAQQSLLADWPRAALCYLEAPNTHASAQALADVAANPLWLHPVSQDVLPQWVAALNAVEVVQARGDASRATEALPEHVELSVPTDVDRNVLNSLLAELPQHAQRFSELVQSLAHGGTLEDMDQARRVAHTLKGAGSTVGVKGVANLTHVLEDILVAFDREKRLPTRALHETLIEAADCLEAMSESLVGETSAPPESLAVYQKVLDWANRIDADGLPDEDVAAPVAVAMEEAVALLQAGSSAAPDLADAGASESSPAEETESYLRVPASLIDSLLKLAGENAIITSQLQDRVTRLSHDLYAQRTGSRHIRQLSSELEQLVDVRGMAMLSGGTGELDALEMDQYNELHMLSRRIMESAADSQEFSRAFDREIASFRDLMAAKERTQLEIQRSIQRTRMVEVASIAPRLQRTVRQAARVLEKSVMLIVRGETTLVDTQLLNRIMDPLMHMLRNAVDHGIELSKDRIALGKPATGTITLTFSTSGSNFAVRCVDDGRGLNLASIRAKAIQSGLIQSDDVMSDAQIMRLTMLPGFSTREQATLISGRGVGMDVVQRTVTDLRGMLDLNSEAGLGARFDMAFPVQLSATQVMMSRSPRHLLAISERSVEQLLPIGENLQLQPDGSYVYVFNGDRIPALRLETLLGLPSHALSHPGVIEVVMIVFDENRQRHAVVIPEASDSRNVVVKPFNSILPRMIGVDGATIMGDGSVAVVIDLPDLLRGHRAGDNALAHVGDTVPVALLPLCLIVDDSVSVRRTMEQLMQDAGYDVASARDGIEALGELQKRTPDVVLVDLEMPRMNGLQFTHALRNQHATKNTPVVMITSRFTEKHHQLALEAGVDAFLTKPYAEEQLLNTVADLLSGKTSATSQVVAH
jgi:chemotaxis protein histidine kinase CheA/ActR/RegA family two-component response regulator